AKVDIAAHGVAAVIWLDCRRQRISREVRADAGFYVPEQFDIASVSNRVRADAEGTSVGLIKLLFNLRLAVKQLVFVYQLRASGEEISATDRQNTLDKIGIHVVPGLGAMISPPHKAG